MYLFAWHNSAGRILSTSEWELLLPSPTLIDTNVKVAALVAQKAVNNTPRLGPQCLQKIYLTYYQVSIFRNKLVGSIPTLCIANGSCTRDGPFCCHPLA